MGVSRWEGKGGWGQGWGGVGVWMVGVVVGWWRGEMERWGGGGWGVGHWVAWGVWGIGTEVDSLGISGWVVKRGGGGWERRGLWRGHAVCIGGSSKEGWREGRGGWDGRVEGWMVGGQGLWEWVELGVLFGGECELVVRVGEAERGGGRELWIGGVGSGSGGIGGSWVGGGVDGAEGGDGLWRRGGREGAVKGDRGLSMVERCGGAGCSWEA
ncbi:hypothetical protein Tco_1196076 [Tanacetum coccineum]|uniref:Uncharacterized protein n=1 Tax=Tanacetum coccineum TaxID=301880 RepID=A0ABQ5HRG5_9ASTR